MGLNTKSIFMLFNIFNIKTCMTSFHMHNTKEDKSENVSGFLFIYYYFCRDNGSQLF